jgi:hypothetical protein
MSAAAVIAVIVAAGEAHSPLTDALARAAKEAVGSAASVEVREASTHTDRAILRAEASLDALAAVALYWNDDQHLHAHTRLHVARSDRWIDREIGFEPGDSPSERGRTLGFTIASMLPEAGVDIEINLPESFGRREVPTRNALQVAILASVLEGNQGAGPGVGGDVGGERLVTPQLAGRAGLALRQLTLEGQDFKGTALVGALAVGAVWWFIPPAPEVRLNIGLRADVLAVLLEAQQEGQTSTGQNPSLQWQVFPGADLMVQGTLHVATNVDLVAAIGGETIFRDAKVRLNDPTGQQPAAYPVTIRSWRAVAEAGLRFHF